VDEAVFTFVQFSSLNTSYFPCRTRSNSICSQMSTSLRTNRSQNAVTSSCVTVFSVQQLIGSRERPDGSKARRKVMAASPTVLWT
ncbi:hypothetical protein BaRGS_00008075, partial [Batillaria attramentaria]